MPTLHERFSGLFIPHVTPFDESGALDIESLSRLTAHFASLPGVAGSGLLRAHRRKPGAQPRRKTPRLRNFAAKSRAMPAKFTSPPSRRNPPTKPSRSMRDLENLAGRRRDDLSAAAVCLGQGRSQSQSPLLRRSGAQKPNCPSCFFKSRSKATTTIPQPSAVSPGSRTSSPLRKRLSTSIFFSDTVQALAARPSRHARLDRQRPLRRRELQDRRRRRADRRRQRRDGKMGRVGLRPAAPEISTKPPRSRANWNPSKNWSSANRSSKLWRASKSSCNMKD